MPAQVMTAKSAKARPVSEARRPAVDFGRETAGDPGADTREWLVSNGIGGFASGTVTGQLTRRYHGLLTAALKPPLGRTLLVTKFEETVSYSGSEFALSTNRWAGGAVAPEGYQNIEGFLLDGTTPVWIFACADAQVEKRVWMEQGSNTTCVRYNLLRASGPLTLTIRALVNYRDYHSTTRAGDWRMNIQAVEHGLRVIAFEGSTPFFLLCKDAEVQAEHDWYRNFELDVARYRGLDNLDDHLHGGTFRIDLRVGESVTFVLTTDASAGLDGEAAWGRRLDHERSLLDCEGKNGPLKSPDTPAWVRQLVLAADQFVVSRPLRDDTGARSLIAGYHWFGDWGRDTMIALPGLTLTTGRPEIAASILHTFSRFVDRGMLPNRFPDAGEAPEYNTVDATLWYFEAVRHYFETTRDADFLRDLFPVLEDIVAWHVRGTRYNIHVDPADGLLYAGEAGVQLTWMDAKVGDWVVTPRIGKPIEVNALWYNALVSMGEFARILGKSAEWFDVQGEKSLQGFGRFWNKDAGWCFDVLDGPDGNDPTLRPNQLFAVSLPASPLSEEQQKEVVDICGRRLLTSHGLRSLDPADPRYRGHYGGDPFQRDSAYHQGTVWGWLLGPFVLAHLRVYKDRALAVSFLEPMAYHLRTHGLGTASEIFDGDAPFRPRGCIAQAWTVGEVLRAWVDCQK